MSRVTFTTDSIIQPETLTLTGNSQSMVIGPNGEVEIQSDLRMGGSIVKASDAIHLTANGVTLSIGTGGTVQFSSVLNSENTQGIGPVKFCEYLGGRGNCTQMDGLIYIDSESHVKALGQNNYNRFGVGATVSHPPGVTIGPNVNTRVKPSKVFANDLEILILMNDGTVYGAGHNPYGQLSLEDGSVDTYSSPFKKCSVTNVVDIAMGEGDSPTIYYLTSNGSLYAAGNNQYGQIGDGTTTNTGTSGAYATLGPDKSGGDAHGTVKQVKVAGGWNGSTHPITACALYTDSTMVKMVGYGGRGQMGNNTTTATNSSWVNMSWTGTNVDTIHTCGYDAATSFYVMRTPGANINIFAWGANTYGQIGNGSTADVKATDNMDFSTLVKRFWTHGAKPRVFAKKTDGYVYGCGYNGHGALGLGDTSNRTQLTQITALDDYDIYEMIGPNESSHTTFTLAFASTGHILMAGDNANGQLSMGDLVQKTTFTLIYSPINNGLLKVKSTFSSSNDATYPTPCVFLQSENGGTGTGTWIIGNDGYMYACGGGLSAFNQITTGNISYLSRMPYYV